MSSGGGFAPSQNSSNVATNVAPTTSQTAPAPSGGKGGYNNSPMTMEDFAQQRPQVYMPPAQPTFYDQAFNSSYYNPGFQRPRMDYGLGSMGNAYVRRMPMYSPPSPIEARPPMDEMNYAPGGYDLPPQQLISRRTSGGRNYSWGSRRLNPDDFQPLVQPTYAGSNPYTDDMRSTYAGPISQTGPVTGGPGAPPPREQMSYAGGTTPGSFFDRVSRGLEPPPVAATQGVRPEPNYSGGLGSLMGGMSGPMQVPAASQDVINRKLQALNQGFGPPV